jgi:hemerythrin-like domain-containing protein
MKGYLYIHNAFRSELADFEKAVQLPLTPVLLAKLSNWLEFYWQQLEMHHIKEDDVVFPEIIKRASYIQSDFDILTEEHHEIVALVNEIETKLGQVHLCRNEEEVLVVSRQLRETATRFKNLLSDHLTKEEDLLIPAVRNHFSEADQKHLEESLQDDETKKQIPLLLTWIVNSMSAEERQKVFKESPFMLKMLYKLVWKKKYTPLIPSL